MKTIGNIILQARQQKNLSIFDLSQKTKIKKDFLIALEKEDWPNLPDYAVVCGFIKNLSDELNLNKDQTMAFLRRDYPPSQKPKEISPKPDLSENNFKIGPKLIFFVLSSLILLTFGLYLYFQYRQFTKAPFLQVTNVSENLEINEGKFTVVGITDKNANVLVNNQPALIDENGNFAAEILINSQTDKIEIVSQKRNKKETKIVKQIKVIK